MEEQNMLIHMLDILGIGVKIFLIITVYNEWSTVNGDKPIVIVRDYT